MTNLNSVVGMNKYCGPAVLAVLTGKSTDDCAYEISRVNGNYNVTGVTAAHLLKAASRLGFDSMKVDIASTLYGTLVRFSVMGNGMYVVELPNHYVAIEVNDKKIFFCDNHTKEPMPAASSARMLQKVTAAYKVFKRPETIIPPKPKPEPEIDTEQARIDMLKRQILQTEDLIVQLMDKLKSYKAELEVLCQKK